MLGLFPLLGWCERAAIKPVAQACAALLWMLPTAGLMDHVLFGC